MRTPLAHLSHMLNLRVLVGEKAIMWGLAVGSWTRGSCSVVLSGQRAEQKKTVQGQRGPKRGFPTLRCDAPGGGWRYDAATLRGAGVALRRCDTAVGPVTLRRCWRCDAATLRHGSDAATLLALRRCDAGATLRRCWRCDASFCKSARGVASRRDTETPIEDRQ